MNLRRRLAIVPLCASLLLVAQACALDKGDRSPVGVPQDREEVGDYPWNTQPWPAGQILVSELRVVTGAEDAVWHSNNPPIWLIYEGFLPSARLRWIQIVVDAQPQQVANITRANFDCVISQGEAGAAPAGDPEVVRRNARIAANNPFYKARGKAFRDAPSRAYSDFETYIILCYIRTRLNPGPEWKAQVMGVWHWKYSHNQQPLLEKVPSGDPGFLTFMNQAMADFQNGFNFETWYNGDPPSP